jgi:hypothetical protein
MGEVIKSTASPEKIEDHAKTTLEIAEREGGEIAEAARNRVGKPMEQLSENKTALDDANKAVNTATGPVMKCDATADTTIKNQRDTVWQTIGRPRESTLMNTIYPGGVKTYTDVDVHKQPTVMEILIKRLKAADHPKITQALRDAWSAEIEAVRAPYAEALVPLKSAEANQEVENTAYLDSARAVARGLVRFKRDLKNMDMNETQIHKIIPDASSRKSSSVGSREAVPAPPSPSNTTEEPEENPPT